MSPNRFPLPLLGLLALAATLIPRADALAETDWRDLNRRVIDGHVVPGYRLLDSTARALDARLRQLCEEPTDLSLTLARDGLRTALDAWNGISHLRFGPVETEQRFYRLQLWPDKRGIGSRQVRELLAATADVRLAPAAFVQESVAVQGLSALEILLFPEGEVTPANFAGSPDAGAGGEAAGQRCRLALAIGRNVSAMTSAILADWTAGERPYRDLLLDPRPDPSAGSVTGSTPGTPTGLAAGATSDPAAAPGPDAAVDAPPGPSTATARFTDARSVSAEFLKSLSTGAQIIDQQKLAGPLGASAEMANPRKAESWRSHRSLANVCTNLRALQHLYETGFAPVLRETPESADKDRGLALTLAAAINACLSQPADLLDVPINPDGRKALEELRDLAGALQSRAGRPLAVELDLMLGFNSLDGD